jgi:riboflavin biosynthesis pyrimidine reductase
VPGRGAAHPYGLALTVVAAVSNHGENQPASASRRDALRWSDLGGHRRFTSTGGEDISGTRLERRFDPAAVRELKAAAGSDLTIGGADLTARAFRAGLVDECRLVVLPALLGGGKPGLPTGVRADLRLLGERRFGNGAVLHLHYRVRGGDR